MINKFNFIYIFFFLISFVCYARVEAQDCKEVLKHNFCYTNFAAHWIESEETDLAKAVKLYQNRTCMETPIGKLEIVLGIYDSLPEKVQKVFCHTKKVYLVAGAVSFGARVEYHFNKFNYERKNDEDEMFLGETKFKAEADGFVFEISEANRFKNESSSSYMNRVLQARFSHNTQTEGVSSELPIVEFTTNFGLNGALATTIVHEIGHLVAKSQDLNDTNFKPYKETPWSNISWNFNGEDSGFALNDFDMYQSVQQKNINKMDGLKSIKFLQDNGFASFYGSTNPDEDFAEMFMFYFYRDYKIKYNGGVVLDLKDEIIKNKKINQKFKIIDSVLSKKQLFDFSKPKLVEGKF